MIGIRATAGSIVLILLAITASAAHSQLGGPTCLVQVGIGIPRYLGKQAGKDTFEVSWSAPANASLFQAGIGVDHRVQCAAQEHLLGSYTTALTIERRLGHRDSGSGGANGQLTSLQQVNVQVPRDSLETDPKKYELTVNGTVAGTFSAIAKATGNGAQSFSAAALSTATSITGLPSQCAPVFAITAVALSAPDTVSVTWSAPGLTFLCLKSNGTSVQVKLVRADGTSVQRTVNAASGSTTVQVPLGEPAGQVASFEVTVSVVLSSTHTLGGQVDGTF
jgi:hypothetical protein